MKRLVWFVWLPVLVILCLFLFLNIRDQAGETQKQDFVSKEIENIPKENYYDRYLRVDSILQEMMDEREKIDSENIDKIKDYDYYQKQLEAKLKELGYEYSVDNGLFCLIVQLKNGRNQEMFIRTKFDEDRGAAIYRIVSVIIDIHDKVEEENLLVEKILSKNDESLLDPTVPLGFFHKYTGMLLYEMVIPASVIADLEFFLLDVATVADETGKQFTEIDNH